MPPTPRTLAAEPFNPFSVGTLCDDPNNAQPFVSCIAAAGDFKPLDFSGSPGWSNQSIGFYNIDQASPFDCVPVVPSCVPSPLPPRSSLLPSASSSTSCTSIFRMDAEHWSSNELPNSRRVADEFDRLNALYEQQLEGMEDKGAGLYCAARARLNYLKNRYSNILALEHSRVRLMGANEFHLDSDYINANYIDGEVAGSKKAYICCQAPLPNTLTHFWLMLWENECAVIVMLTRLFERDRAKATQYWPEREGESRQFALFTVTLLRVKEVSSHLTLRKLRLEKDGVARTVMHFHYTEWPDFGAPSSTQTIRDLVGLMDVYKMHGKIAGLNGPIVAHCSAGVGRAGTFVAIHMCLEKMKHHHTLEVNVAQTVMQLRKFRAGMVQTQEQYRFIYEVLRDARQDLKEKAQRMFAGSGDVALGKSSKRCSSSSLKKNKNNNKEKTMTTTKEKETAAMTRGRGPLRLSQPASMVGSPVETKVTFASGSFLLPGFGGCSTNSFLSACGAIASESGSSASGSGSGGESPVPSICFTPPSYSACATSSSSSSSSSSTSTNCSPASSSPFSSSVSSPSSSSTPASSTSSPFGSPRSFHRQVTITIDPFDFGSSRGPGSDGPTSSSPSSSSSSSPSFSSGVLLLQPNSASESKRRLSFSTS